MMLHTVKNKPYRILRNIFCLSVTMLMAHGSALAQDELDVLRSRPSRIHWHRFSNVRHALYDHLAKQAFDLLDNRSRSVAEIRSLSDWQKRQALLRKTLADLVGPFPEKTPLHAKVLKTIKKATYRIEHIVYESQPGFHVTSSMFIPNGVTRRRKAPVVIHCSGHHKEAYRGAGAQQQILNLVKKGFVVFAFDPIGQGERLGYYDPKTGSSTVGGPTAEHSYPGIQAFISGSSMARFMIWDGVRAVDYLLTREEVDGARIGITGLSGGGTQSAYIAAFDDRIYAAAPGNYITNFRRLMESIGPQDAEQNLFDAIARGIDHADLLAVRAPKPALMITTTRDFFSIQGARETAKEVSGIYKAYGQSANFGMVEDDTTHASTKKNREATYAFFQEHLKNPGSPLDVVVELLTEEELRITETGQVSTAFGGETVFTLNRTDAGNLLAKLENARADPASHLPRVLKSAEKIAGYQKPAVTHEPVFTGRVQRHGYVIEKYFVNGEGDYVIPYLLMKPDKPNDIGLLYLHPSDKAAEATPGAEIEWFVRQGFTVLAPDLIGFGIMGPSEAKHDHSYLQKWYSAILIGRSIVGMQAGDISRVTGLLKKYTGSDIVYGVAKKELAPVLLHAAAFDSSIQRIALIEPYASYRTIVMNRFYDQSLVYSMVPGALEAYDLPDLAASLAPRKLLMVDVKDGLGEAMATGEDASGDLTFIRSAYSAAKADGQVTIKNRGPSGNPNDHFSEWIK